MDTALESKKKNFEHYPELPLEIQMMIVNKMPADDRGRFSTSSRLSFKEVEISKNYIREFKFKLSENDIFLQVKFGNHNHSHDGFRQKYSEKRGKKLMRTENLRKKELGLEILDKSTNLMECAVQHSRDVLNKYQDKIKRIQIEVSNLDGRIEDIDFKVESLKHVEEIELTNVPNLHQFLSKTRKNLKDLAVYGKLDPKVKEYEQVHRDQRKLFLSSVRFTKQEFLQLSAQVIFSHIGNMTEDDIFDIVKSWKQDLIWKDFVGYGWFLLNSNFDATKFFKLFGVKCDGEETTRFKITHEKDDKSHGMLVFNPVNGARKYRVLLFVNIEQAKNIAWKR